MKKLTLILGFLCFAAANGNAVKVLLSDNETVVVITASGAFTVRDANNGISQGRSYQIKKGGVYTIKATGENCVKFDSIHIKDDLYLIPEAGTTFTTNKTGKNTYTGTLKTRPSAEGFKLIEEIGSEEYLYGVLPFEMSAGWPLEALKVQAVAARTYAAGSLENPEDPDFDVYSGVMSQMYKGTGNIIDPQNRATYAGVIAAVDGTKGEVLTYKGVMFTTYYHSNCGGSTCAAVWGKPEDDIEPLRGSFCGACVRAGDFKNKTWSYTFTNAQIQNFTATLYTDVSRTAFEQYMAQVEKDSTFNGNAPALEMFSGKVTAIVPVEKTADGRAVNVMFVSAGGDTATTTCQQFRLLIGAGKLKSCNLDVITQGSDGSFTFSGRGFGHGVGMCQVGAKRLAEDGKSYRDILAVYYPGAEIIIQDSKFKIQD